MRNPFRNVDWHNVANEFLQGLVWTAGAATAISITALIWRTLT